MVEDLKNIASNIDRLWHDIMRVRNELTDHPEAIASVDQSLIDASLHLVDAEDYIQDAVVGLGKVGARATQQDADITAAIALLESKGFVVGTKT